MLNDTFSVLLKHRAYSLFGTLMYSTNSVCVELDFRVTWFIGGGKQKKVSFIGVQGLRLKQPPSQNENSELGFVRKVAFICFRF